MTERAEPVVPRTDMASCMKDCYRGRWRIGLIDGEWFIDTLRIGALNGEKDPEAPDDTVTYTFWSGRVVALSRIVSREYVGPAR